MNKWEYICHKKKQIDMVHKELHVLLRKVATLESELISVLKQNEAKQC